MKIIDKRGRLFGLISIIDIVVIIVVAVLAAGIYIRFFSLQSTAVGQPTVPISYSIKIAAERSYKVDALKAGDTIFNETGNEALGVIKSVTVTDAEQWGVTEDGTLKKGLIEGKYDIVLEIEADGVIADGRYYVSRTTELGTNRKAEFTTKYCTLTGVITSISG